MVERIELTDGFVLLRPYQLSDTDFLYEAVRESIDEVSMWFPWCRTDHSLEESRTFVISCPEKWEKGIEYAFAIINSKDGSYLGSCSLYEIRNGDRTASMSYWVRTRRTKKGIATAATKLLARFGFNELKMNRLEIIVATANEASLRVAEKSGAAREGVLRHRFAVGDKIYDAMMFSLIPEDMR